MEEIDKYRVLIDPQEFQEMILEIIEAGEVDNFLIETIFAEDKKCKQAVIYGMNLASTLAYLCEPKILKVSEKE